jgi:transposase-like protein
MPNHPRYPDELRERAVRMVLEHGHEYGSQWEAICSVAEKLGPKAETVRLSPRSAPPSRHTPRLPRCEPGADRMGCTSSPTAVRTSSSSR